MADFLIIGAPHFTAGMEKINGKWRCAPIIKYMRDWSEEQIREYCRKKKWNVWDERDF